MLPENEKAYQQLIESGKLITGKLLGDFTPIFDDGETVQIIPEFDENGDPDGLITAQTWGTWNPQEIDNICLDDIINIKIVPTWK
jgi:hypothetical protein